MKQDSLEFDYVVIGAGSAGCAAAWQLAKANVGTIAVLEAGLTNAVPQVRIPFGLAWTRGSRRDWRFTSTPQAALNGKKISVTRGKMLGGSSSINSMVWFRGRQDDYDGWDVKGWSYRDVEAEFDEIEALTSPRRFATPHALSQAFGRALNDNGEAPPTPERESAGVFHCNLHDGERWSAADAFLEPAKKTGRTSVLTSANVDKILTENGRAKSVLLSDGRRVIARAAVILCAGSIGTPAILMRSGFGPAAQLQGLGIEVHRDMSAIGENLHDHPAVGLHFQGAKSGYGLALDQFPAWAFSPLYWLAKRRGRLASNVVEAGAFFRANPVQADGNAPPDCQSHFIPFMVGYKGHFITWGSGYSADVNVCRPFSRGQLKLSSVDPDVQPSIDLGLLSDDRDLETLVLGVTRLRKLLGDAPFDDMRAPEVYPGADIQSHEEITDFVRARCATAYHPVGTVRMGQDTDAPVSEELKFRGLENLWVGDASIMPKITTANTNAPSMMIGQRAGKFAIAARPS